MKKWLKKVYEGNKSIVWAAVVAIVLALLVLWRVQDEVTRFTLIMPLFAGFILFSILTTADEELDDVGDGEMVETKSETPKTKKASKK
jgi:hypothetical protein